VSEITIRAAVPGDAERIAAIHHEAVVGERGRGDYDGVQIDAWAHAHTAAELREPMATRLFLVAESAGEPVGYAQLDLDKALIRSIYVAVDHQHCGVGARLGRALLEAGAEAGLAVLELDSSLNAVSFYQGLGFRAIADVDHRFRNGAVMRCVHMMRDLEQADPA